MPTKIVMPRLSLTMKEGTVGKWYKNEGNPVEKGEPIAEVVSEKATYDLEAPASGLLRKILVGDGSDVPVNAVLGIITDSNEVLTEGEIMKILETEEELSEKTILASPAAKRLARELGIDLSTIKGSGPDGRVSEEDVKIAVEKRSPERQKIKEIMMLTGNRKTTAERLSASFRNAPHSTIFMDVEASSIISLHEKLKLSYTALIAKCVADSLLTHPMINSTLDGDRITIFQGVNLGVAMATKYGLIVPIIHDADKKTAAEIDTEVERLAERATEGKLSSAELNGGTFTITNLGMFGVDSFVPIINPPEAAILAVGRLAEKPIVIDHKIEVKPTMTLSLSYDHRIVDGAPAANFLRDIKSKIEKVMNV